MPSHLHIVMADGLTNAHRATGALLWIAQGRRSDYLSPGRVYSAWVPLHCARVNMLVNGCQHCQQLLMNRLRSGAIRLCANAKWFLCTYIRIDSLVGVVVLPQPQQTASAYRQTAATLRKNPVSWTISRNLKC